MKKTDAGRSDRKPNDTPPELELEGTTAQRLRGLRVTERRGSGGYDPYDAPPRADQARPRAKRTDLRKLSEWMRLRREVEEQKAAEAAPKDKPKR